MLPDDMKLSDVKWVGEKVKKAIWDMCLANGWKTVGDLRGQDDTTILREPNVGRRSLTVIRAVLEDASETKVTTIIQLHRLNARREKIAQQLADIDGQIAALKRQN